MCLTVRFIRGILTTNSDKRNHMLSASVIQKIRHKMFWDSDRLILMRITNASTLDINKCNNIFSSKCYKIKK